MGSVVEIYLLLSDTESQNVTALIQFLSCVESSFALLLILITNTKTSI